MYGLLEFDVEVQCNWKKWLCAAFTTGKVKNENKQFRVCVP
jgi:hypothetical protein